MSMLAERKRKQKWSLNPRGKEWSQDANKFGQKMLEKMGWQHGKGLGSKLDGITEHVKISYKNDNQGMGYKETNDQWTEHESNFSALLESLTGKEIDLEEVKVTSLEQKSQISRARVHYHKFTRGKDLSRASEKDLANIFGRKSLKTKIISEKESDPENKSNNLVNGGSMKDYFKKKIPNFGKINGYILGNNGVLKKEESDSESEYRPSFGFGFNKTTFITENGDGKRKIEDNEDIILSPKKKSKKGLSNPSFNPMGTPIKIQKHYLDPIEESTTEDKSQTETITTNKLKKNKIVIEEKITKKEKKNDSSFGLSNPAFNPMRTPIKLQKHILDPIEESITEDISSIENLSTKKKITDDSNEEIEIITNRLKKKKKNKLDLQNNEVQMIKKDKKNCSREINVSVSSETKENAKIKKKYKNDDKLKKNKKCTKIEVDNPNFDETEENVNVTYTSQLEDNPYEIKLKKDKKRRKIEVDNPNFDETEENVNVTDLSQLEDNPYEIKLKKDKKRRKIEVDNPNFDETEENVNVTDTSQLEDNPYEIKLKKDKKRRKIEVDNPNFDETEENVNVIDTSQLEDNPYEIKLKKDKKRRKIEVDNTNFDETEENNPYEIKQTKKKKKNKVFSIDNPSFVDFEEKPTNPYEVKSKKKQNKLDTGTANPALDLNNQNEQILNDCDLILNVVSTPIISKEETLKNRKSVIKDSKKFAKSKQNKNGLDNLNFDKQMNNLDENVDAISKTLDNYEAEIENGINEEKINSIRIEDLMVGEVGTPHGENEKLPDGTKLKFKYANMDGRTPFYQLDKVGAKKSYKHLIKGDILVKFKNTNLHEIEGYAVKAKNKL